MSRIGKPPGPPGTTVLLDVPDVATPVRLRRTVQLSFSTPKKVPETPIGISREMSIGDVLAAAPNTEKLAPALAEKNNLREICKVRSTVL